ncbi:DUF4350 domain-containing protein [Actinoplanes sp. NPDC051494]|uniref:DUF4350 domain-containing protein n=1 Tax=Actinoplanes sp. NPDC051494 TaxID=3363907 RepID=UPI003798E141
MRNPRRLRMITPFAVVLGLVTLTVTAHLVQQPDPYESSFLSPTSDAGDGARLLAEQLVQRGVQVDVRAGTAEALDAIGQGDPVTLFVTTPELVHPMYLRMLTTLPARVSVVMVAPGQDELDNAGVDVTVGGPRWTAAAPEAGCAEEFAESGPMASLRWRYSVPGDEPVRCYDSSVVRFRPALTSDLTLVGASDPFRNDRAGEHSNQAGAVALLGRDSRVIWVDLHEREQLPPEPSEPPREPNPTVEPDETPDPEQTGEPWDDGEPRDTEPGEGTQAGDGEGGDSESPLAQAFPPAVWATLLLLALAGIALALASARRLGTPVAEPLPAQVRAAETVRGLGGLYRRARARGTSLATVQAAARARLLEHFGLPPDTEIDELAVRVAARTGLPENEVRHTLGGGVEDSDEELARAASGVQRLVKWVTGTERGEST